MVLNSDWDDKILLAEFLDESSGNGSTNLELLNKNCSCDAKNLWYFLDHSFEGLLVEEDGIVKLLLYLGFGPGLFLGFGATL